MGSPMPNGGGRGIPGKIGRWGLRDSIFDAQRV